MVLNIYKGHLELTWRQLEADPGHLKVINQHMFKYMVFWGQDFNFYIRNNILPPEVNFELTRRQLEADSGY